MIYSSQPTTHGLRLVIIVSSLLLVVSLFFAVLLLRSANPFDQKAREVAIPQGSSVAQIKEILISAEVLKAGKSFVMLAQTLGWQNKLQAGKYYFSPSDSLIKILYKLKTGRVVLPRRVQVTFPEGTSIYKMAKILEKEDVICASDFEKLVDANSNVWKGFIPFRSLEGYLFPDTYLIFEDISAEALAGLMFNRFKEIVFPFWEKAKKDTKYNLHEILTLASIIEKEASLPQERPIISSVFHNRLHLGMPLAADPTIKYALERPTKKVYHGQLEIESPYNTYKSLGLPPGPICNPGLDSIRAAVYPAETNYLYFVAQPDGSHIFSVTWKEHQKARRMRKSPGP